MSYYSIELEGVKNRILIIIVTEWIYLNFKIANYQDNYNSVAAEEKN